MEKEIIWKEIPEFNGKYFISNTGVVKSYFYGKEKIVSAGLCHGYKVLGLTNKQKERKTFRVHRLVAIVFLENDNPEIKTEVHHKDNNTLNNHVDNLEWCTHISNCQKDYVAGKRKNQKNTPESINKIRNLYLEGNHSQKEIAKMFNLSQSIICDILNGNRWGYVK
jgi:hypothetical protein